MLLEKYGIRTNSLGNYTGQDDGYKLVLDYESNTYVTRYYSLKSIPSEALSSQGSSGIYSVKYPPISN